MTNPQYPPQGGPHQPGHRPGHPGAAYPPPGQSYPGGQQVPGQPSYASRPSYPGQPPYPGQADAPSYGAPSYGAPQYDSPPQDTPPYGPPDTPPYGPPGASPYGPPGASPYGTPPQGAPPYGGQYDGAAGGGGGGKAKAWGKTIAIRLGAAAVLAIGVFAYMYFTGDTELAQAGDCITKTPNAEDMKIAECDSPEAAFKVEGTVDGVSESAFKGRQGDTICKDYPKARSALWQGDRGKTGEVLCLSPLK